MKNRNYGVDLLKSISMLMIVILHVLGVGGVLAGTIEGTAVNNAAWLLETMNICAVNCFGLVSGYVLCKGRYRRSRLLSLWLRVVFEALAITVAFAVLMPGVVGVKEWFFAVTPVLHDMYWYFTAYFALFFFVPYINKMIASLSGKEMVGLAFSVVFIFTFLGNITGNDIFHLHGGYGFLWLLCLYLLGACLRHVRIRPKINKYWFLALYFISTSSAWGIMEIFGSQSAIGYTSPLILLAAALLLLFFRRLDVKPQLLQKTISMLARTSFGVYIIHTHPLVWNHVLSGRFASYAEYPASLAVLAVILSAAAIYAVCTLGDWLVEKFFKLIRVDLLEKAVDGIGKKHSKNSRKSQNALLK
ncbi:MAG: acyltransferase [Clostridiales bacterium]|nr:acyltransferase [Clostridiales bacterium]